MTTATIEYKPALVHRQFVCYSHTMNDQPLYVGACLMSELTSAPDARRNSEWARIVTEASTIIVRVVSVHDNFPAAQAAALGHALITRAHCNIHGHNIGSKRDVIVCVETGEQFATAAEAARAHGISASNLSNHLSGKPGFRAVKGRTYHRKEQP